MSGVSVTVNDAQINAALSALRARVTDLKKPMTEVGGLLVTLTDLCFKGQRTPWGDKWEDLKASTLARRRKSGKGARILRDTGILANSISAQKPPFRVTSESVTVGTMTEYARIHQFGGDIERAARTGTMYFRQNKDGTVGNKMVKKSRSNFAQDVNIGAHKIHIPARPFLPIRPDGRVDLPERVLDSILETFQRHIQGALK